MIVTRERFGSIDGHEIFRIILSNGTTRVVIINYGATLVSIDTVSRSGKLSNIIAGLSTIEQYRADRYYLGSTIGRYANRIANGRFQLNGKVYTLSRNDGPNHLHGGYAGFNQKVWNIDDTGSTLQDGYLTLSCLSPDGEEGYPGTVKVHVRFTLTVHDRLVTEYFASADQPTPFNITAHPYFNLTGFESPTIYGHALQILSDSHLETDDTAIPTGKIMVNTDTAFDFSTPRNLGDVLLASARGGLNHTFILTTGNGGFVKAARLYEPESGRSVTIHTDQPGLQVYSSNEWDGTVEGVQSTPYLRHGAIALETQHFPDAPNRDNFPPTIIGPGKGFYSKTEYAFGVN